MQLPIHQLKRVLGLLFLSGMVLAGCTASETGSPTAADECPVSEPRWAKPAEDSAVQGSPGFGHYFINEDETIWASAGWAQASDHVLYGGDNGIKVGWFRPAGARLNITAQRLDDDASGFEAIVPCCYPTRFQATGLAFPTAGCWEVTASASESELSFVVWIEP